MKILLAEDDALIAMDMQAMLEDAGHAVFGPAATVAEGEALARAETPDMAVVDIGLKNGDSGVDLARSLQRQGIPVVFVSGEPTRAQAGRDAAIAFLPKPVMSDDLIRAIALTEAIVAGTTLPDVPVSLEVFRTEPWAAAS